MPITITVADVRSLFDAAQPDAVLYVELDEETGEPSAVSLSFGSVVNHHQVITTREALVDWLQEDATDEDIAEYLSELQDTVVETVDQLTDHASA